MSEEIGALAIAEHGAWVARNAARAALRAFLHKYHRETGEWFHRDEAEPEDQAEFDALRAPAIASQKVLTTRRAATRRAIVRATPPSPAPATLENQQ